MIDRLPAALLLVVWGLAQPCLAGERMNHAQARLLSQRGEILPLDDLLQRAQQILSGKVLEVELERYPTGYRYEIELLDEQGRVWELEWDAATGKLIEVERED